MPGTADSDSFLAIWRETDVNQNYSRINTQLLSKQGELLYSEELVTQQGFEVNGMHYGTMFDYGDNGSLAIPVKDGVLLQYAEDSGLLPGTLASFQGALDRIDSAKVYSDLDLDIYNLYETWHFERPEESLEELVDRTVSTMEMTLAE